MKHFVDIQAIREKDIDLGDGAIRPNNVGAFTIGDHIQITEKFDGANGSIAYNSETDTLIAFSRKKELNYQNTNQGFWNYVHELTEQTLRAFRNHPFYVLFGEWAVRHSVRYNQDAYKKMYGYDIWDTTTESYLTQDVVKAFCEEAGIEYIHVVYDGEFLGWDHVMQFTHMPAYGDTAEGIVIKNQDKLDRVEDSRNPSYIKIVNDEFKESKARVHDELAAEKSEARTQAESLLQDIVTEARVRKEVLKMIDEGILPNEITPQCMKDIARNLPKRVYDDCVKEEPEIISKAGEYAGKICSSITMKLAKEMFLGK